MNKKVFVTGSGGFIGGRVIELFYTKYKYNIRANVRKWSSAARIGRFPIEIVAFDLNNEEELRDKLKDVDYIVHCAVGSAKDTVNATDMLLKIAFEQKIKKVVYLSTVEVYDSNFTGEIFETTPMVKNGDLYGDLKVEAEKLCLNYIQKGLSVVILRPSIVYGIFSKYWTIKPVERILSKEWNLPPNIGTGKCNLIYVDDLVEVIDICIKNDHINNMAINVNGSENLTWREYFTCIAESLGVENNLYRKGKTQFLRDHLYAPLKNIARYLMRKHKDNILKIYERSHFAKLIMKHFEYKIKVTNDLTELSLYNRNIHYSNEKLKKELNYSPSSLSSNLKVINAWLKFSGYIN